MCAVLLQLAHVHVVVFLLCQEDPQPRCFLTCLKAGSLQQYNRANNNEVPVSGKGVREH